ncbi:MAG: cation-transporting P-type ATPase [Oligoflexia bacterium]|nr:cation-transporting P-type ATPase [Oligoflexia bacterium]
MNNLSNEKWHHLPLEKIIEEYATNLDVGLKQKDADDRINKFGANEITAQKKQSLAIIFLSQFHQPLVYILILSGTASAILGKWTDALVIFLVVLINAIIGFIQEIKATKAIESLAKSLSSEASVLRDGEKRRISSTLLVSGDIVLLSSGDKVPADLRLISAKNLQVNESALTGESLPVQKQNVILDEDVLLADRTNMLYASSLVTYGQGTGVVIATGDKTEMGKISKSIATAESHDTPLTKKIAKFSNLLLYIIIAFALITFIVGIIHGQNIVDVFMAAVALSVAAIPEALPAAVTITLAIGVNRMAKRRAIIRKLPAVETLGSTTVICSDKTGTLTENQMTVQFIWSSGIEYKVTGVGYAPIGSALLNGNTSPLHHEAIECLRAGLLCNDSKIVKENDNKNDNKNETYQVEGDPTEGALITASLKLGLEEKRELEKYPRIDSVPFESENQYMATLHRIKDKQSNVVYLKGSLSALLPICDRALSDNPKSFDFNPEAIKIASQNMAKQGLRVLAFARKEYPLDKLTISIPDIESGGFSFLGLQAMIDPPREEAKKAVRACRSAGIQVKMITGDQLLTASKIAQEVGLSDTTPIAITGKELAKLKDDEFPEVAEKTTVFARVTPEQKLKLVKALQQRKHIVAMTGDGVNDAPALKQANIGVAMGITGTEVSKEAADMVLTDDNFASIEAAVEEGRCVFDNLIKFISWTIPTNLGQGLVVLLAIIFNVASLPLLPVQILWINTTSAILLGLTLAFESKSANIMQRHPRKPDTPILTNELIFRIVIISLFLVTGSFGLYKFELYYGASLEAARTVAVNVFIVVQTAYLLNCRSLTRSMLAMGVLSNRWLLGGVSLMFIFQFAFVYLPIMNKLFHTAPVSLASWGRVILLALVSYLFIELEKWIRYQRQYKLVPLHENKNKYEI